MFLSGKTHSGLPGHCVEILFICINLFYSKQNLKPTMMNRPLLYILLNAFLIISPVALGQGEERLKSVFVEAESFFLFEEYKDALPLYQRLLKADPENYNLNYKIGICYLNDIYQYPKSVSYLEMAVKGINPDSRSTSFKEKNAPPEAFYYLGNAYRANNRLKEAEEAYNQFKLVLDPAVYDVELVDAQIEACHVAAKEQTNPMYFISGNLGEKINDRFEEINPVVSGDESVLVFTRKLQFYDAVFCCRKVNGRWTEPENLTPYFGVDGNTYSTGLSYDGNELVVYRSDNFDGNLYVSLYKNGKWTKLEKLNANINTKYWESHASFSKDGKTLYFTSNRAGGYGGLDIYKSQRTRGGEWGPAINLGPVINSKYHENTPFVTEDGNTLYFSSTGHYNMGGFDIFYSTRLDNGQWTKPVNAGYPLNTTSDDEFFTPVGDGAYAYYAKYNAEDTYGMTDIYKLEVFTDLHPRKFILNGISRVDGMVRPDYSQMTATLTDPKTGKIIDQARLNPDGTFRLDARSGNLELQIRGTEIQTKVDQFRIPLDNPSNIVSHTTMLTPATAGETAEAAPPATSGTEGGPEMIIGPTVYNVSTGQSIPIRIDLDRNTTLQVLTQLDGVMRNNENFSIKRKRFVYMATPEPGTNLFRFTLTDENGNTTVREVTINYTPQETAEQVETTPGNRALTDAERYMGLGPMASGNLQKFLRGLDMRGMNYQSLADLYEYLLQHAAENNYTQAEVEELMARYLSQKDVAYFFEELKGQAADSLVKTLEGLDLQANSIYSSEALMGYLYSHTHDSGYNLDELREALYRIAAANRDPASLIDLLLSYSEGQLAGLLRIMKDNAGSYPNTRSVADYLLKSLVEKKFPASELESALMKAAADLDMHFLYQSLLFISGDSLRQALLGIDFRKADIHNTLQLVTLLFRQAELKGYTKRELINNIEKIRKDPYFYVDLFRKLLANKATGSLKVFLQEIDIRNLKINTFEQLVDYLLNQSQFNDFNREMVYQLLIDIIDVKDVNEFIELLLMFCDDRIAAAMKAARTDQFSKPFEVVQYLLTVAEDYKYTERDIMRVLLKMLLRKGPEVLNADQHKGWLRMIDRPAMVVSLVLVNAAIILLLILFILRKKKKNEENSQT